MKRTMAVAGALILFSALQAAPAAGRGFERGDRIRVRTGSSSASYTLHGIANDTLYVFTRAGAGPTPIAFDQVSRIDVRVPRSKTAGMLWGALLGGGIGSAIGIIYAFTTWDEVDPDCGPSPIDEFCDASIGAWYVIGMTFAFGAPAMLLGGIIGAAAPGERWKRADFPGALTIGRRPDGAVFLHYTRSF